MTYGSNESDNVKSSDFEPIRLSKTTERNESSQIDTPPIDKANAVYFTFLLFGIGVLLPFNVIMACLDYYAVVVSTRLTPD